MSLDLMYKATDKATWDAYLAALPEDVTPLLLVDEIGPIVITPAILDEQGEVVTEAVIDPAHHVNVRYLGDENIVAAALSEGGPGVEWIDPAIVTSPERIWAGGMNYWTPPVSQPEEVAA